MFSQFLDYKFLKPLDKLVFLIYVLITPISFNNVLICVVLLPVLLHTKVSLLAFQWLHLQLHFQTQVIQLHQIPLYHLSLIPTKPKSVKQALAETYYGKMNKTWGLVPFLSNMTLVANKWLYWVKLNFKANVLTKSLSFSKFQYLKAKLQVASSPFGLRGDKRLINLLTSQQAPITKKKFHVNPLFR